MHDYDKAIKTLEYNKILEMLAECAMTEGAKEMALATLPDDDETHIRTKLSQTTTAKRLSAEKGAPFFGNVKDITGSVDRAEKGAMLTTGELLDVTSLLESVSTLIDYSSGKNTDLGSLEEIFQRLTPNKALSSEIRRIIISEDIIADDASPALAQTRRAIRLTNNKIRETLQKYITAEQYSKYLQENIVTIREGRYVIPVKAEHKNEIKGLVHDTSSTGATMFIEPLAVVEANNELRELEVAEKKEIERILYTLSDSVARFANTLISNYRNVTLIAYIFARSELSWKMKGVEPMVTCDSLIDIKAARHPLLRSDKVVPVDIRLGGSFDTLIITGPNTGGKTVALKTLGLFTLMAQSGLHIPAGDGSKIRIFEKVLPDIGDEQSIEQSLSTFSAHMTNIVKILDKADKNSLVLYDELGAGTDPVEGAALAVAIIESTREKGALCAATTHYAEVKMYAIDTPGVSNAACEFDIDTLSPTYRLIIGAPGKSNAFAISERLGLSRLVIDRAAKLVSPESKRFEEVIDTLEKQRQEAEKKLAEAEKLRQSREELYKKAELEYKSDIEKAIKERDKAAEQARRMIESARAASDFVMGELERAKKAKDSENYAKELEEARRNIRRTLSESYDDIDPVDEKAAINYTPSRPIVKGDEVRLININKKGTVTTEPDKDGFVMIRTGNIRMKTSLSNLMLLCDIETKKDSSQKKKAKEAYSASATGTVQHFSPEIDLRGKTGEEAAFMLDRYFDNAILAGMHTVRVIHGKGTGALRRYLWEVFRTDNRIASFRIGAFGEGDGGVTVVELK